MENTWKQTSVCCRESDPQSIAGPCDRDRNSSAAEWETLCVCITPTNESRQKPEDFEIRSRSTQRLLMVVRSGAGVSALSDTNFAPRICSCWLLYWPTFVPSCLCSGPWMLQQNKRDAAMRDLQQHHGRMWEFFQVRGRKLAIPPDHTFFVAQVLDVTALWTGKDKRHKKVAMLHGRSPETEQEASLRHLNVQPWMRARISRTHTFCTEISDIQLPSCTYGKRCNARRRATAKTIHTSLFWQNPSAPTQHVER